MRSSNWAMAVRRVSPGAKLAIFLLALVVIGLIAFFAWRSISAVMPGSGPNLPEEVVAGETFEPGEVVDLYGSETEAVLEGTSQQVQAQDPTEEWMDGLEDITCDDADLCTAAAPAPGSVDGDGDGGFLGTGLSLGALAGGLLFVWIFYVIINEENN